MEKHTHKLSEIQKEEIINRYLNGESGYQLAKSYNVSQTSIMYVLKRNNISRRSLSEAFRKYKINENFFDNFDNEFKAYWLGWILSDGNHYRKKYCIRIQTHIDDYDTMVELNELIESNRPIKITKPRKNQKTNTCQLFINNKHISDIFYKLDIYGNKTFKIKFPYWLDKGLLPHFIRAYSDGDGTIFFRKYSTRLDAQWKICGTYDLCYGIQQELIDNNIPTNLYQTKLNEKTWEVCVAGNQHILKLMNYLYQNNNICSQRKYSRFLQIKEQDELLKYKRKNKPILKCSICDGKRYKKGYCFHHWYELAGGKEKTRQKYLRQKARKIQKTKKLSEAN